LRGLCPDVNIVKGDFDDNSSWPDQKIVQIGDLKFGLCHGHQIVPWGDTECLAMKQREMDVDVLVTGHTHKLRAMEYEGKFLVNPGSITGAYHGFSVDVVPSFVLLDVQGSQVVTYVYELHGEEVKVEKIEYAKKK
jgi:vacuolar protein sorting-associated protein 29